MVKYIALLRGINVGGKTVKMDRLRAAFEAMGFTGVQTYIQSGNVLFVTDSDESGEALRMRIEKALLDEFGFGISAILLPSGELDTLVTANPYAGRQLEDGEMVYMTVFGAAPPAAAAEALTPETDTRDEYTLLGRAAYILCRDGYGRTVYSNAYFERKLKIKSTTRNMDTMAALIKLEK